MLECVPCVVCCVLCAVCCVRCAVCCVLCAVCCAGRAADERRVVSKFRSDSTTFVAANSSASSIIFLNLILHSVVFIVKYE